MIFYAEFLLYQGPYDGGFYIRRFYQGGTLLKPLQQPEGPVKNSSIRS